MRAEVTKSTADDVTPKQRLLKTCVSYLESSRQHRVGRAYYLASISRSQKRYNIEFYIVMTFA